MWTFTIAAFIFLKILQLVFLPVRIIKWFQRKQVCPPPVDEVLFMTASVLAEKIRKRQISSEAVVKSYIARAKETNPLINAIYEERFEQALAEAKQIDLLVLTGDLSENELKVKYPLLGVPITVKQSIPVTGMLHNSGVAKRNIRASCDAIPVCCAKQAGAVPLLTSNVPELCLNWETTNAVIGTTRNPYDTTKTAGGSSGGEAALLGAGASLIGIGSDIGGSLRLPAHFCGVWGHKPSPGVVSFEGHYPSCTSRKDWTEVFTLGPMARYASDLRMLLQIIMEPEMSSLLQLDRIIEVKNIKVYYMEEFRSSLITSVNNNVLNALKNVVDYLDPICSENCTKLDLPLLKYAAELSYLRLLDIDGVENLFDDKGKGCYSELARFLTGRSQSMLTSISYGVMRRNAKILPKKLMNRLYEKLNHLRNDFIRILGNDGVFICPVYTGEAHPHNFLLTKLFDAAYLSIFNALGFPATSCPVGFTDQGLPIGVQVVGAPNCDRLTLSIAEELERKFGGWKPTKLAVI